ncbi:cytochrome c [Guyparkeria hydrothermalis]|uniref:cytochrome c n=1 Tax=Guyparkeria hydrothermalis TaxID=923 RepID=UPI0020221A2E|nr:cytochrome c [Guyparkeria hydrothermalis]MCL7744371.1 cytochrome c [Guyparkeria hydrothermalis]
MNISNRIGAWVAILALAGAGAAGGALADEGAAPHEFHEIMEDLGDQMVGITEGITHEDWIRVAEHAEAIANHPRPPMSERVRIMAFAGTEVAQFKKYDKEVHEAASSLADTAAGGDGSAVISAFGRLQNGCLDCHAAFRSAYREHFHSAKD